MMRGRRGLITLVTYDECEIGDGWQCIGQHQFVGHTGQYQSQGPTHSKLHVFWSVGEVAQGHDRKEELNRTLTDDLCATIADSLQK